MSRIPVSEPDLSGNEEKYVLEALRSTWISSTGTFVKRFESEFAAAAGCRTAITVSNGTLALHLALLTMGVRPGDEVIVPSLTYIATANAVRYCGAEPVFVDVSPDTWCLDPAKVEAAIGPRTRGIVPVHLYGHPADMDALNRIAAAHGLWVVEDAAEAHLARYRGRPVGGLGRIGVFSFYGNKVLSSGEGGAVTLDDPDLERKARMLRGQGMDPERRYFFPIVGYNYRLTNLACAILCAQLERSETLVARRREAFRRYRERLEGIPGIGFQPVAPWAEVSPWMYCVTVDPRAYGRSRDDLMALLDAEGIETRPFFIPIHTLPPYVEEARRQGRELPVTDALGSSGLNLPTFPGLSAEAVDRVAEAIRSGRR